MRDRVWFFFAGRRERSNAAVYVASTGLPPYHTGPNNDRYEIKITGTAATNHTHPGQLRRQQDRTEGPPQHQRSVCRSTPRVLVDAADAEPVVRDQLQRRASGRVRMSSGAVFAEEVRLPRTPAARAPALADSPFLTRGVAPGMTNGQHYHAPFFSTPRSRGSRQPAIRRQRHLLPDDAGSRQPQSQSRGRAFHVEPPWRQLPERDRSTSSSPTTCSTGGIAGARCAGPPDSAVRAWRLPGSELAADARRHHGYHHAVVLRAGSLGGVRSPLVRPRLRFEKA